MQEKHGTNASVVKSQALSLSVPLTETRPIASRDSGAQQNKSQNH